MANKNIVSWAQSKFGFQVVSLEKAQAELRAAMLTQQDIEAIVNRMKQLKREVGEGIDIANASLEEQRWFIERLNVEATLRNVD